MSRLLAAFALALTSACTTSAADSRPLTPEGPWVTRALDLQDTLVQNLPLGAFSWRATHNSFHSSAYPDRGVRDPNQLLTLSQQLDLQIQSIELDLHWVKSARTGEMAPLVCHALSAAENHLGCASAAADLRDVLSELRAWFDTNPERIVLIDLEDQLYGATREEDVQAHDDAVQLFDDVLGPLIYRPPPTDTCETLPLQLTLDTLARAGAQVLLTSGCGAGDRWPRTVFNGNAIRIQDVFTGVSAYPDCDANSFAIEDSPQSWTRLWEDRSLLTAQINPKAAPVEPDDLRTLTSCGLSILSLDQLTQDDPRLDAWVWSWAQGEPSLTGDVCASLEADGHLHARACQDHAPIACLTPEGGWALGTSGAWSTGKEVCEALGASFAPAHSAADLARLRSVADGTSSVWIGWYDDGEGHWLSTAATPAH